MEYNLDEFKKRYLRMYTRNMDSVEDAINARNISKAREIYDRWERVHVKAFYFCQEKFGKDSIHGWKISTLGLEFHYISIIFSLSELGENIPLETEELINLQMKAAKLEKDLYKKYYK